MQFIWRVAHSDNFYLLLMWRIVLGLGYVFFRDYYTRTRVQLGDGGILKRCTLRGRGVLVTVCLPEEDIGPQQLSLRSDPTRR